MSYTLNGALGGLVGITANCDSVNNIEGLIIGAVAGVLVCVGMELLENLKIDDAVGAWSVHGLCGIWGGIATGIFGGHSLVAQIVGSIAIPVWAFVTAFILFKVIKALGVLRVSPEEEAGRSGPLRARCRRLPSRRRGKLTHVGAMPAIFRCCHGGSFRVTPSHQRKSPAEGINICSLIG